MNMQTICDRAFPDSKYLKNCSEKQLLYFTDFYCRFKRIGKVYITGDYFGELAL